jgi:hypothetical protein
MPDVIEPASSGRAKCRGCQGKIEKDVLRYGEAVPNAFGEGEALHWYHLRCGAEKRPESFIKALAESTVDIAERSELERVAAVGIAHPRLSRFARLERASSGRARCQACHEVIEKGALRLVLERVEEGMVSGSGFVHVDCALAYAGSTDSLSERMQRSSAGMSEDDFVEMDRQFAAPRTPTP